MITNPKAIIFDRDGVLIDTDTLVAESMNYAIKEIGIKTSDDEIPFMAGISIDKLKSILLSKWDFDFDKFREIQRGYFYKNLAKAPIYTDMINYIKYLSKQNVDLALTTSAGREGTLLILNNLGIKDLFKVIITKDDCSKHKPDPEPYLLTSQKLGLSPKDCVVIEDSGVGLEAAKNANMACITIPNQHTKDHDFSKADLIANTVEEIKNFIVLE